MFELLNAPITFFGISFGAALGSNLRFYIVNQSLSSTFSKSSLTCFVNIIASFFLGLLFAVNPKVQHIPYSSQVFLSLSIGFLGSLSTFSTFIYDLNIYFIEKKYKNFFYLVVFSVLFGFIAAFLGFLLGS